MNIAILFGGSSYEHEISIVSAITMKKVLKKSTLTYIFVDANREVYLVDTDKINSKLFSSGAYKKGKKLTLKKGGFWLGQLPMSICVRTVSVRYPWHIRSLSSRCVLAGTA